MFNYNTLNFRLLRPSFSCITFLHTLIPTVDIKISVKSLAKKMTLFDLQYAVLRYQPGAERFSFSFLLQSGKLCNFDRSATESITIFEERVVANLMKKFKMSEINVKVQLPVELQDKGESMRTILDELLSNSVEVKFQINDATGATIVVNPPEINSIKFYNKAFVGLPVLPYKLEASPNFLPEKSLYTYKATKDSTLVQNASKPKVGNVSRKMSSTHGSWTDCESKGRLLIPNEELEGSLLRFTCTPSDGKSFGVPFIVDVPTVVQHLPVENFVYKERLSRLSPIDTVDQNTLRIVSYNILADTYATEEWFAASPPASLEIGYRLPLICKELESYNADIVCLQEVDDKVYNGTLEPFLQISRDCRGIFSCKTGNTKEGVASFYNTSKLNLLEHETSVVGEKLKTLPFYDVLKPLENLTQRIDDRNTIVQIVVFENKNSEQSLLVLANTHLYFHPNADHIRLLQTMVCIRMLELKVEELKKKYPDRKIRTFFCGDFNCTPPYGALRLLTTGKVTVDDEDWTCYDPEKISPGIDFEHGLKLNNSHPGEELTNIVRNFEGCIDYILYQPENAQVINVYPPPSKATIASIMGIDGDKVALPNYCNPSDHLPLIADFKLTN